MQCAAGLGQLQAFSPLSELALPASPSLGERRSGEELSHSGSAGHLITPEF
jgi:hypothetical protein